MRHRNPENLPDSFKISESRGISFQSPGNPQTKNPEELLAIRGGLKKMRKNA